MYQCGLELASREESSGTGMLAVAKPEMPLASAGQPHFLALTGNVLEDSGTLRILRKRWPSRFSGSGHTIASHILCDETAGLVPLKKLLPCEGVTGEVANGA